MSQRIFTSLAMAAALVIGAAAPAAAQAPVRVGGDIKEPKRLVDVRPVYPEIAQQAGVQGIVIVEAVIGTDGAVESARILRPVPLLDQAALDAVTQWRYEPTLLNGQPVPVIMTVTVSFTLDSTGAAKQAPAPKQDSEMTMLLDSAKAAHQRGQYDEAERMLQKALAAVQADRVRTARVITGPMPPTPTPASPHRVGGSVAEPTLLKRIEPAYPAGTAPAAATVAEIIVGADGRVTEARVLRSQGADFDRAVVAAVRQWLFKPTMLNGVPVPVIMTVTIK